MLVRCMVCLVEDQEIDVTPKLDIAVTQSVEQNIVSRDDDATTCDSIA